MPVEIKSVTEALLIARQSQREGQAIPISPCNLDRKTGKVDPCSLLDPKLENYCKHPDGLLPGDNGGLECPKQWGQLKLIYLGGNGEHSIDEVIQNSTTQTLGPAEPTSWSNGERKLRRPYFVK